MYRTILIVALCAASYCARFKRITTDVGEDFNVPRGNEDSVEAPEWTMALQYAPTVLPDKPAWGNFPFDCKMVCVCAPPDCKYPRCDADRYECCRCCERLWHDCIWRKWGYSYYHCYQKALLCVCRCDSDHKC